MLVVFVTLLSFYAFSEDINITVVYLDTKYHKLLYIKYWDFNYDYMLLLSGN